MYISDGDSASCLWWWVLGYVFELLLIDVRDWYFGEEFDLLCGVVDIILRDYCFFLFWGGVWLWDCFDLFAFDQIYYLFDESD